MIVQPEKMDFDNKKFSMILYGSPGVGKTTLALSAPDPLLIDFDRGMSRVKAQHRKAAIFCNTYEEVMSDLHSPDIKDFQTIIIDTGGSFVSFLKDWAFRTKPDAVTKSGQFNSLKGFGHVKSEFESFTNYVRDTLNKYLIYIFHSVEQTDKDGSTQQRLMCEGAAKNIVWTPCDFGAYIQMIGEERFACFSPEQEYFAKGCHGITGKIRIPALGEDDPNDFLTKLFARAKTNIAAENEAFAPIREKYEHVMVRVAELIDSITDLESADKAAAELPNLDHALTSKREASALLQAKAKELGFKWSKDAGKYVDTKTGAV